MDFHAPISEQGPNSSTCSNCDGAQVIRFTKYIGLTAPELQLDTDELARASGECDFQDLSASSDRVKCGGEADVCRIGGKRLFDLLVATALLLVATPLLLAIAAAVRARMGSPVLFRQVRPGHHAKPFEMIKFRTMLDAIGPDGLPLPDSARLTPLGRFLRATSLDELPELWNVLKGDMSLVGPRPLAMSYLPLYSKEQWRRHEVLPGITGWAQINGRNGISWAEKFRHDVWYVDNANLMLDLRILLITARKVLARENVRVAGQDEVKSFDGSN